jgi:hypothetical protein
LQAVDSQSAVHAAVRRRPAFRSVTARTSRVAPDFGGSLGQEAQPHARRTGILRAKGKPERARKHGLFTRDAIAERRQIQELLGEARKLLEEMK